MSKLLTADDIFPLVTCLTPEERLRLLRLISIPQGMDDGDTYRVFPPIQKEFSSDNESLAWDADGWEDIR